MHIRPSSVFPTFAVAAFANLLPTIAWKVKPAKGPTPSSHITTTRAGTLSGGIWLILPSPSNQVSPSSFGALMLSSWNNKIGSTRAAPRVKRVEAGPTRLELRTQQKNSPAPQYISGATSFCEPVSRYRLTDTLNNVVFKCGAYILR